MPPKNMFEILEDIKVEAARAVVLFGEDKSLHEGYAVILEELDELWAEIKKKKELRDPAKLYEESIQVAAMAAKIAHFIQHTYYK